MTANALHHPNLSYWMQTTQSANYPRLEGDVQVDVCVVGAGIVGVTTALLLKQAGATVALVEAGEVAGSVSGYTTAKVTSLHSLVYHDLIKNVGEDRARMYAQANQAGVDRVAELVADLGIDCDLERLPAFTYAESPEHLQKIQDEVAAAATLGLPASFQKSEIGLPYEVAGAVRVDDQLQFHPRKYLLALAAQISGDGSYVFEGSRVTDVDTGDPCTVKTDRGLVSSRELILATHMPIVNRGFLFAKAFPRRAYAVGSLMPIGTAPRGMYISVDSPSRSVRYTPHDAGSELLIVTGEGHTPGDHEDTGKHYEHLTEFAVERFGVEGAEHRWSTQDYFPADKVPFIGEIGHGKSRLMVGTGFSGWGMSNGTAAAMMLSGLALGERSAWLELFDPTRKRPYFTPKFAKENTKVGKHFLGDRVAAPDVESVSEIAAGEGKLVKIDGDTVGVFRDESDTLHAVNPTCTHLGCLTHFNEAEKSWDCPCHGSRFDIGGKVLNGPAVKPLSQVQLPAPAGSKSQR